jgi:CTP synthase
MSTKFIFITGGVVSSLGKGLATASLGALLQARGYKVRIRKLDPYLNIDPGTMSPIQHGEVFVTDDGAETDLDLGHYERFTGNDSRKGDNVTAGKIYETLLKKERRGDYLGNTVQVIPHVTNLIKDFILTDVEDADFILCEIGGTVGDIEALPFFEAIRQLRYEFGFDRVKFIHLTLVPYIPSARELKTKPTQHSVKELSSIGIQPDILLCRSDREIPEAERKKIALFCNIKEEDVIPALDVKSIYEAPINLHNHNFDVQVLKAFGMMPDPNPDFSKWYGIIDLISRAEEEVEIAIVGKYVKLRDAYKSLIESLYHAAINSGKKLSIKWINSRSLNDKNISEKLENMHGILVPGGFGEEGTEGMILAIKYARENKIPFLGICLGMQLATVEIARNLCGMVDANSTEFTDSCTPVVALMTEWKKSDGIEVRSKSDDLGGSMRLGSYPCNILPGTKAQEIYGTELIHERHRHRYEISIKLADKFKSKGVVFSGVSPDGLLPEILEVVDHPWFVATQYHPEFKSKPFAPSPLFLSYFNAAYNYKKGSNDSERN